MVFATSFNVDQEHCICNVDPDFYTNYFGSPLPVPMDDLNGLDLSWSPPNSEIRLDDTCFGPMDFWDGKTSSSEDFSEIGERGGEGSFAHSAESGDYFAIGEIKEELEPVRGEGSFANSVKTRDYVAIRRCKEERDEGSFANSMKMVDYYAIRGCKEEREPIREEGSFANSVKTEDYYAIRGCKKDPERIDKEGSYGNSVKKEEVERTDDKGSLANTVKLKDSPANKVEIDFPCDFAKKGFHDSKIVIKKRRRTEVSYDRGSFANTTKFEDSNAKKVKLSKLSHLPPISGDFAKKGSSGRRCSHSEAVETPQWREGPLGPKTLCNACGVRYKSGRLVAEYRPANSPSFNVLKHSNFHQRITKKKKKIGMV